MSELRSFYSNCCFHQLNCHWKQQSGQNGQFAIFHNKFLDFNRCVSSCTCFIFLYFAQALDLLVALNKWKLCRTLFHPLMSQPNLTLIST